MATDEWIVKTNELRALTGLTCELDFNHFVKFKKPCLDIRAFVESMKEVGYTKKESIETFLTEMFCEEAAELFREVL